jgi:hypothetical protein
VPVSIFSGDPGLACGSNRFCVTAAPPTPPPACGGTGQACCGPGTRTCEGSQTCFSWLGPHGTCMPCGAVGQPSCLPQAKAYAILAALNVITPVWPAAGRGSRQRVLGRQRLPGRKWLYVHHFLRYGGKPALWRSKLQWRSTCHIESSDT